MSNNLTDQELFKSVKAGNEDAFEILFKLYYAPLCTQAVSVLNDNMVAEEIVSDFFLKIWLKRNEIEIKTTVNGYFSSAIKFASLNKLKVKELTTTNLDNELNEALSEEENPLEAMVSKEILEEWEVKIQNLPPQRQKAFRMVKLDGLSYAEAAKMLSVSERTVRNHVQDALKSLNPLCVPLIVHLLLRT